VASLSTELNSENGMKLKSSEYCELGCEQPTGERSASSQICKNESFSLSSATISKVELRVSFSPDRKEKLIVVLTRITHVTIIVPVSSLMSSYAFFDIAAETKLTNKRVPEVALLINTPWQQ